MEITLRVPFALPISFCFSAAYPQLLKFYPNRGEREEVSRVHSPDICVSVSSAAPYQILKIKYG